MAIFQPGEQAGRFTIRAQIAANHRYECYRAESGGESFVIKLPSAENPHRDAIADDLGTQFSFLAPERCPVDHIAHYLEVLPIAGSVAVVMRHFEGRPLTQLLCDKTWTEPQRWLLLARLATIIDGLHAVGVMHRDVSDGNVLVDQSGLPVLIDFELSSTIPLLDDSQMSLVSGSRFYKSPEQWAGLPQDGAVDVYAFALLASYVLGRCLPEKESLQLVDLTAAPPWCSGPRLDAQTMLHALATNPMCRPRTCAELLNV